VTGGPAQDAHHAITAVWRDQAPRLIGGLLRITRDLDLAEDLAHDALLAALQQWPDEGVPANPGSWLMAVAKRRAVDQFRRAQRQAQVEGQLGRGMALEETMPEPDHIEDDVLRLMLVSCHPALTTESQVALTLRLLGGLSSKEIARAFMVPEPTVVRRITRAKRTLGEAALDPFDVPGEAERARRLPAVLHVIYLIFTEGYAATAGDDWLRPALCEEAIRLGRLVAGLFPREPEVHGLLALMQLQSSRTAARTGPNGEPVLLPDQDRSRWDQLAIRRGLESLSTALRLDGVRGAYTVQAAIAACHARSTDAESTDWQEISQLYDVLAEITPSPVVRLNRAVAHGMAFGPEAGLALVDELGPELAGYHLLPSVRADLLVKLDRVDEARAELERAVALAGNQPERALLQRRLAALDRS
jgi:RNA polymerase sigma factor (sigma-70 family)